MCRSIVEGGRRCPSSFPEYRAAYRKARRAATNARAKVIGTGGSMEAVLDQEFNPVLINEISVDISALSDFQHHDRSYAEQLDGVTEENRERFDEMYGKDAVDAALRLKDQMGKDSTVEAVEAAVIQVGHSVANEAERRAGVSAEEIAFDAQQARQGIEYALDENMREIRELTAQRKALEDAAVDAYRNAQKHHQHMVKTYGPGSYDAQEAAEQVERARRNMTEVKYTEQMQQINEQVNALQSRRGLLHRDHMRGMEEAKQHEALTKLSNAYVETLAEIRPMGGETVWSDRTTKKAAAAFQQVAELFPTEWIEQHNAGPAVYARISKSRAHYNDKAYLEQRKRVRSTSRQTFDSYEDFEQNARGRGWGDNGQITWREATAEELEESGMTGVPGVMMVQEHWRVARRRDGSDVTEYDRPKGKNWEMYRTQDGVGPLVWRQPQHEMKTVKSEVAPEITTNAGDYSEQPVVRGAAGGASYATSSHEMCHRFEKVVPGVALMERAFLKRRTTGQDGAQEPLKPIYPGARGKVARETGRPDKFVNAYIGKEYGRRSSHEVLSMGVESVFSGRNGGLVGAGRYDADTDHRAFVLGTLATVGRDKVQAQQVTQHAVAGATA